MNASSVKKVRGMIGSTLRDLILRNNTMDKEYEVIQEKEKELAALRDAYNNNMNVQDAEYESILELMALDGSMPRTNSVISNWRAWFNYHPDHGNVDSSDFVMKKIIDMLKDKEDETKEVKTDGTTRV